jgi:hypothetical protein
MTARWTVYLIAHKRLTKGNRLGNEQTAGQSGQQNSLFSLCLPAGPKPADKMAEGAVLLLPQHPGPREQGAEGVRSILFYLLNSGFCLRLSYLPR